MEKQNLNNKSFFEVIQKIEGTPFAYYQESDESEGFLVLGNYKLMPIISMEEAIKVIGEMPLELLMAIITSVVDLAVQRKDLLSNLDNNLKEQENAKI